MIPSPGSMLEYVHVCVAPAPNQLRHGLVVRSGHGMMRLTWFDDLKRKRHAVALAELLVGSAPRFITVAMTWPGAGEHQWFEVNRLDDIEWAPGP